ncbi:MAG: 3-isopropylmalate dehydrogenase [Planctomycetota bacterium]|nr:MAG: 3-isopropylmalate dehydrogenase [Planctomycetota bacterium]
MNEIQIAQVAGDGIGPEVTEQCMRVLDAAGEIYGFKARRTVYPFSTQHWIDHGQKDEMIFPEDAFREVRQHDAVYLGAIGDPRAPVGKIEYGIIAKLRFELDLYINLRPIKLYDERLCPLKGKTPADIDMVIVRENTEGAYAGMFGFAHKGQPLEVSTQTMVYTREGVERAIRFAFAKARERNGKKHVYLIDKANAIRAHDIWRRTFEEVGQEFPDIKRECAYVDAAGMWMIKNPEWFDVAVTTNLFGDILTDLGAMIQGGMGIAASANLHPGKISLFEPIHGSAPKYAGKNVACPVAAILAGSMLLDYCGQKEAGRTIEGAVKDLLVSGRIKGVGTGDHKTSEVGDLVVAEVRSIAARV